MQLVKIKTDSELGFALIEPKTYDPDLHTLFEEPPEESKETPEGTEEESEQTDSAPKRRKPKSFLGV